eukprot:5746978-Pyramimonas_sp.AAC.1
MDSAALARLRLRRPHMIFMPVLLRVMGRVVSGYLSTPEGPSAPKTLGRKTHSPVLKSSWTSQASRMA